MVLFDQEGHTAPDSFQNNLDVQEDVKMFRNAIESQEPKKRVGCAEMHAFLHCAVTA